MTLQEVITSDIDDVFLTDHAKNDVYTPQGATAKTIKVIFDNEYIAVKTAGDMVVESCGPAILCKTADVSNAKHNETHVIDGTTYFYVGKDASDDAMTVLKLSKDAA